MNAASVVVMGLHVQNLLQIYFSQSTQKDQVIINILKYIMHEEMMLI